MTGSQGQLDPARIEGWHAHVYFDPGTRPRAERLRAAIAGRYGDAVTLGRWRETPVGPHSKAMYQVAFPGSLFAEFLPWLMANRQGLDVLVHARSGLSDLVDHTEGALWLGRSLPLDLTPFEGAGESPAASGQG